MKIGQRFVKGKWMLLGMMLLPGVLAQTSCIIASSDPDHEATMEGVPSGTDVYCNEEPPPPRDEVAIGVAPGPSYIWVSGYWAFRNSDWYWVRGRWAARPNPRATWAAGRWEHRGHGYIWISGCWR